MKRELITLGIILFVGFAITTFLMIIGGAIILNGVVSAILTVAGFTILIIKSPMWIRRGLAKLDLLIDIVATLAVFVAFGGTFTGLIAAGVTCIFVSAGLRANKIALKYEDGKKCPN